MSLFTFMHIINGIENTKEELGEIVTKLLTFQTQYKAMTSKLDSTIDGLVQVLKDHGLIFPK